MTTHRRRLQLQPIARLLCGCRPGFAAFFAIAIVLAAVPSALARTITLDVQGIDRLAGIDAAAPLIGWAMHRDALGTLTTVKMDLIEGRSMLMRFGIDKIPAGQRIAYAELVVPVNRVDGTEPRFYLWRMLADWGAGVCHEYRSTRGEKLPWTRPGAKALASDRAEEPTAIVRITEDGKAEKVINVTEDVELWYTKRAPNNGWILTVEDPGVTVEIESPLWPETKGWSLRITYEPANP